MAKLQICDWVVGKDIETPIMCVTGKYKGQVRVAWTDINGQKHEDVIREDLLRRVDDGQ